MPSDRIPDTMRLIYTVTENKNKAANPLWPCADNAKGITAWAGYSKVKGKKKAEDEQSKLRNQCNKRPAYQKILQGRRS